MTRLKRLQCQVSSTPPPASLTPHSFEQIFIAFQPGTAVINNCELVSVREHVVVWTIHELVFYSDTRLPAFAYLYMSTRAWLMLLVPHVSINDCRSCQTNYMRDF